MKRMRTMIAAALIILGASAARADTTLSSGHQGQTVIETVNGT